MPDFVADAKAAGITSSERQAIINYIAMQPQTGDLIVGSGGARKVRLAGRGKGKSGGYRVITFFGGDDIPVFLLNVFAKSDRVDLTRTEVNGLREVLSALASEYRKGVRRHVKSR